MSLLEGIIYRPEWDCFLCRSCRQGVRPSQVSTHWKKRHLYVGEELYIIKQYCQEEQDKNISRTARIPSEMETPDPVLDLYHNAFQCQYDPKICQYIIRDLRNIRQHCRTAHNWSAFRARGRPSSIVRKRHTASIEPWTIVSCQRIFASGPGSHFIAVREVNNNPLIEPRVSDIQTLYEQHQTIVQQQKDTILSSQNHDDNRWLKRTGWREFLKNKSRLSILEYTTDITKSSPPYEVRIRDTISSLITRAENLLDRTSHFVRVAIVQVEDSNYIQQPLLRYQDSRQLYKGIRAWQQIVLLFVRLSQGDEDFGVSLSATQSSYIWEIIFQAQGDPDNEESSSRTNTDESDSDSDSDLENSTQSKSDELRSLPGLQRTILSFIISLLDYTVRGWEYESPLVCALAIIAVQPQGWQDVHQFPSILSALIKTSRYLVLQEAYEVQTYRTENRTSGPQLQNVERLTRRFMYRGTHSPLEWMYDLRSYGLHMAMEGTSAGKVSWKGDRITYGTLQLDISQLRRIVSLLTYDTRQLLNSILLFGLRTPSLTLTDLADNPASSEPGFNFLYYSQNSKILPLDGSNWLLQQINSSQTLRDRFFTDRTTTKLARPAIETYLQDIDKFRTNLAVLVHITSGQPARVPELLTIRYRNSYEGDQRGVFIDHGLINLTTSYYKGSSIASRADVKIIQRFLPANISELLVRYLWLVLPWVEIIETQFYSSTKLSSYIWSQDLPNHKFNEDTFRTRFENITKYYLGLEINISSYRHIAIAFSRKFLPTALQFIDLQDPSDDIKDIATSTIDAQAAHSSYVAQLVYGRESQTAGGSIFTRHQQFYKVSIAWHSFLECDYPAKEEEKDDLILSEELVVRRWESLRRSSPATQLKLLLGKDTIFRTKQEEVLRAIYDGISPILAIMPTGSGKSLAFILPASYNFSGVTIVVVPLIALQHDLHYRTTQLSVLSRIWQPELTSLTSGIVYITPESAITRRFQDYLHRLRTTGYLDRIVFDECHIFSESEITFRPAIKELVLLFQFNVRLVFLTATLPVSQEVEFWNILGLQRVPFRTIRACTNRPNLQYRVSYVPTRNRFDEIQKTLQNLPSSKTIIYCRLKRTTIDLAAHLDCLYYYASYDQKESSLAQFRAKDSSIIVTTNALGLGIDIPNVRAVIHYDTPNTLVDYVQESGRAGRDGEISTCILFADPPVNNPSSYEGRKRPYTQSSNSDIDIWIQRYISLPDKAICRRTTISEYMDGYQGSGTCKDEAFQDSIPCDVCIPSTLQSRTEESKNTDTIQEHSIYQSQQQQLDYVRQEVQATQVETSIQKEQIIDFIVTLRIECYRCITSGLVGSHTSSVCPVPRNLSYKALIRKLQNTIRIDAFSGCYECGIPQEFCKSFVRTPKGYTKVKGIECTIKKALFEAAAIIFTNNPRIRQKQTKLWDLLKLPLSDKDREEPLNLIDKAVRRLGTKIRWLRWETNILFRAVVWWYLEGQE